MALARKNRMAKRDFTKRFRSGKRIRDKHCSIHYGPLETPEPKIAIVVQAKAAPHAVDRNSIRRHLSVFMAGIISSFTRPAFVVIIVHSPTTEANLEDCRKELSGMLLKSGIIVS